jgi:protein CpxP
MKRYQGVLAGAALALSAAAAATAYAQAAPDTEQQPRVDRGERHERHERTVIIRRGDDGVNQAEHLRAILQLKPAQEPALTAYLEAMHPKGDHERMMKMGGEGMPKTTPEKLARMEARMNEHEAAMKTRIAATKRFYDQLDPAQKRAFDELPLMMGGPTMPMMGGMKIMHHPMAPMPPMPPAPPAPPRS